MSALWLCGPGPSCKLSGWKRLFHTMHHSVAEARTSHLVWILGSSEVPGLPAPVPFPGSWRERSKLTSC